MLEHLRAGFVASMRLKSEDGEVEHHELFEMEPRKVMIGHHDLHSRNDLPFAFFEQSFVSCQYIRENDHHLLLLSAQVQLLVIRTYDGQRLAAVFQANQQDYGELSARQYGVLLLACQLEFCHALGDSICQ